MHLSAHPAYHQVDLLSLISMPLYPHEYQRTYKFHMFNCSRYFFILRTVFASVSDGTGLL